MTGLHPSAGTDLEEVLDDWSTSQCRHRPGGGAGRLVYIPVQAQTWRRCWIPVQAQTWRRCWIPVQAQIWKRCWMTGQHPSAGTDLEEVLDG